MCFHILPQKINTSKATKKCVHIQDTKTTSNTENMFSNTRYISYNTRLSNPYHLPPDMIEAMVCHMITYFHNDHNLQGDGESYIEEGWNG